MISRLTAWWRRRRAYHRQLSAHLDAGYRISRAADDLYRGRP
jgi:hypothetical protein